MLKKNPGPIETIETVYGICSKNCANLKFVHLNFQSIIRKRMQLKKFLDDMGENTIIGISMSQCGLSANLHLTFPVKKKC